MHCQAGDGGDGGHERLAGTDAVSRLLVAQLAGEKRLVLWGKELIRLLSAI